MRPLGLSEAEVGDLVAFLASLTSAPFGAEGERALARQREIARVSRPARDMVRAFAAAPPRRDPALACAPGGAAPRTTVAMAAR
jgi:cytochrome c peroxidase